MYYSSYLEHCTEYNVGLLVRIHFALLANSFVTVTRNAVTALPPPHEYCTNLIENNSKLKRQLRLWTRELYAHRETGLIYTVRESGSNRVRVVFASSEKVPIRRTTEKLC